MLSESASLYYYEYVFIALGSVFTGDITHLGKNLCKCFKEKQLYEDCVSALSIKLFLIPYKIMDNIS